MCDGTLPLGEPVDSPCEIRTFIADDFIKNIHDIFHNETRKQCVKRLIIDTHRVWNPEDSKFSAPIGSGRERYKQQLKELVELVIPGLPHLQQLTVAADYLYGDGIWNGPIPTDPNQAGELPKDASKEDTNRVLNSFFSQARNFPSTLLELSIQCGMSYPDCGFGLRLSHDLNFVTKLTIDINIFIQGESSKHYMKFLRRLPNLVDLTILSSTTSQHIAEIIPNGLKLESLRLLHIFGSYFEQEELIDMLKQHDTMEEIRLNDFRLGGQHWASLCAHLKHRSEGKGKGSQAYIVGVHYEGEKEDKDYRYLNHWEWDHAVASKSSISSLVDGYLLQAPAMPKKADKGTFWEDKNWPFTTSNSPYPNSSLGIRAIDDHEAS